MSAWANAMRRLGLLEQDRQAKRHAGLRQEAVEIAKEHARRHAKDHHYLVDSSAPEWEPHEWVIAAIVEALESERGP